VGSDPKLDCGILKEPAIWTPIPIEAAQGANMTRYGFNIKTRSGQRVDNICIMAAHRDDAERRLRQMYHYCEIVACHSETIQRNDPLDVEAIVTLISNGPFTPPAVLRSMLRNKSSAH
jgi:hypothetical protein